MRKILPIGLIIGIGIQVSCMQLENIDAPSQGGNSSSSSNLKLKMAEHREDTTGISYYEAILICNKKSRKESLDTLYQYDTLLFIGESLFWLQNIKVLENRSGYRLPTKEEWISAKKNGEITNDSSYIGEWLYNKNKNSQHAYYELAPAFLEAMGLYREREGYQSLGMRVLKVN